MKKFKVYGAEITKSRYGSYIYKCTDEIEAENETEAKAIFKANHKAPTGKRWSVTIRKVEAIA